MVDLFPGLRIICKNRKNHKRIPDLKSVVHSCVMTPKTSWQINERVTMWAGISGLHPDDTKKILDELVSEGKIVKQTEISSDGKEEDLYYSFR